MEILIIGVFLLVAFALFILSKYYKNPAPLIGVILLMLPIAYDVIQNGYEIPRYAEIYTYSGSNIANITYAQQPIRVINSQSLIFGMVLFGMAITAGLFSLIPHEENE